MIAGAPVSVIAGLDGWIVSFFRDGELAVDMEAAPEASTPDGACALGSVLLFIKVPVLAALVAKTFGDMVTIIAEAVVAVATLVGAIEGLGLGSGSTEVLALAALVVAVVPAPLVILPILTLVATTCFGNVAKASPTATVSIGVVGATVAPSAATTAVAVTPSGLGDGRSSFDTFALTATTFFGGMLTVAAEASEKLLGKSSATPLEAFSLVPSEYIVSLPT